jgi:hypothetical protein
VTLSSGTQQPLSLKIGGVEATRLLLTIAAAEAPIIVELPRLNDTDGDGLFDLLEAAFGGNETDPACCRSPELVMINGVPALR